MTMISKRPLRHNGRGPPCASREGHCGERGFPVCVDLKTVSKAEREREREREANSKPLQKYFLHRAYWLRQHQTITPAIWPKKYFCSGLADRHKRRKGNAMQRSRGRERKGVRPSVTVVSQPRYACLFWVGRDLIAASVCVLQKSDYFPPRVEC